MPTLQEENLAFHFEGNHHVGRIDEWSLELPIQRKTVDFGICRMGHYDGGWLLEVKDYRILRGLPKDSTPTQMVEDFLAKIEGSSAVIQHQAEIDNQTAFELVRQRELVPVLHMEMPENQLKIKGFDSSLQSKVLQKLRQVQPSCLVVDIAKTRKLELPWSVS